MKRRLHRHIKHWLVGILCLIVVLFSGCQSIQPGADGSIIVINLHDSTLSTDRIPGYADMLQRACKAESALLHDHDSTAMGWFSNNVQLASSKAITNKLGTYQFCKNTTPPDEMRQIRKDAGTSLSAALKYIPTLTQQLRAQAGDSTKATLVFLLADANDGETNAAKDWADKANLIATLGDNRTVTVLLAADSTLLNQASSNIQHKFFQACPLSSPAPCIEWGFKTARELTVSTTQQ